MQLLYIKNVTGYFETFIELPFRFFEQKKTPITGVLSGYIYRVYGAYFCSFLIVAIFFSMLIMPLLVKSSKSLL